MPIARLLLSSAVVGLSPGAVGAAAQAGSPPEAAAGARTAAVRLEGVAALDRNVVHAALVTRATRCRSPLLLPICALAQPSWAVVPEHLDAEQARRDTERIQAVYGEWGYPAARAAVDVARRRDGAVEVRFRVEEGEPIRIATLTLHGMDASPTAAPLPELPLRPGDVYALPRLEAAQRRILDALARHGHAFARVEVRGDVSLDLRTADVVLEVLPGPLGVFGPTLVQAEPPLRESEVRRRLAYRVGDRFSPAALEHTAERLYRLPVVERVFIDPLPAAPADSVAVTTIGVSVARVQGLGLGGGISGTRCVEGTLGWSHRHLFGAPRTLRLRGGGSNLFARMLRGFPCGAAGEGEFERPDYFVDGELVEPLGADTRLVVAGSFGRESEPRAYVSRGWTARLGVGHALTRELDGLVSVVPERRDDPAGAPIHCALHGGCEAPALARLTDLRNVSRTELSLAWSPAAAPSAPRRGPSWMHPPLPAWAFTLRGDLVAAGPWSGSEFSFARVTLTGTALHRLSPGWELAARGRLAGLRGADEPVQTAIRLFGGGPTGVRGVPPNLLGPLLLTVAPADTARLGCAPPPAGCDGIELDPRVPQVRALGGTVLAELSLEGRLRASDAVQLAAFIDLGWLQTGAAAAAPAAIAPAERIVTPGLGALVATPFGPIRGDVAIDTSPARRYPLLLREGQESAAVPFGSAVYDPFGFEDPPLVSRLWRRLQFQLAIGQPF